MFARAQGLFLLVFKQRNPTPPPVAHVLQDNSDGELIDNSGFYLTDNG